MSSTNPVPEVKPITPSEALEKSRFIPGFVIAVFNELIAEDFNGVEATVVQKDAVALIKQRAPSIPWQDKWLNVEYLYERAGWKVEYDKPAYNETYDATFKFTRKKRAVPR